MALLGALYQNFSLDLWKLGIVAATARTLYSVMHGNNSNEYGYEHERLDDLPSSGLRLHLVARKSNFDHNHHTFPIAPYDFLSVGFQICLFIKPRFRMNTSPILS
jgi:hypothetical protein